MPERDVRINILKGYERKIEIGRGTYTYPVGYSYLKTGINPERDMGNKVQE